MPFSFGHSFRRQLRSGATWVALSFGLLEFSAYLVERPAYSALTFTSYAVAMLVFANAAICPPE